MPVSIKDFPPHVQERIKEQLKKEKRAKAKINQ